MSQAYFPPSVNSRGVVSRNLIANAALHPPGIHIPFNPRRGYRRIDVPIVANAQMQAFHPQHYSGTDKKKKRKHKWRKTFIARPLITKRWFGISKWVSDDLAYAPAATTGSIAWSMNSWFDPGAALTAAAPQWYTELSAIYAYYKVHSCKWTLYIQNTTADMVQCAHCTTLAAEVPPATAAGLTEAIQKGKAWFLGATDENFTNRVEKYGGWSMKKQIGYNIAASTYGSAMGFNPGTEYYTTVVMGSANNISVKYRIVMEMFVELYNLQQNAPD